MTNQLLRKWVAIVALSATLVLVTGCSKEPLPWKKKVSLSYTMTMHGMIAPSKDVFTIHHRVEKLPGDGFYLTRVIENAEGEEDARKEKRLDEYGIDRDGDPYVVELAAMAPVWMSVSDRRVGGKVGGFRATEATSWNGNEVWKVAGREGWTWYYGQSSGVFVGGRFAVRGGSIDIKLIASQGIGETI